MLKFFPFKRKPKLDVSRFDSLISRDMTIKGGTLTYSGVLRVEGSIEGSIEALNTSETKTIIVTSTGYVAAPSIIADFVVISGVVHGKVMAKVKLIVESTGRVMGDISYTEIEIQSGGVINGVVSKISVAAPAEAEPV